MIRMMTNLKKIILLLFICGVIGAETDEVKPVPESVIEGDSVILETNLSEMLTYRRILWRFDGDLISQIVEGEISYKDGPDGIFKDRLQLDSKTAFLTITNMRKNHAGFYKLEAISKGASGTTEKEFSVDVKDSPSFIALDRVETKTVSEEKGKLVTLETDVPHPHDELIVWRFGDEGKLIAKYDAENKKESKKLFVDGLNLDQTGSLIITNSRTTDTGQYTVKISSNKQTLHKRFIVTVSDPGLSSGAAGIISVVVVLLLLLTILAAGLIYYKCKISELQGLNGSIKPKTVKCVEGTFAFLSSSVDKIRNGDQMLWTFENDKSPIATMSKKDKTTYFYDKRLSGRLQLDHQTGSLIIRNLRKTDAGVYLLQIKSTGGTTYRKYNIILCGEVQTMPVKEGSDVTLLYVYPIKDVDHLKWQFEEEKSFIALLIKEDNEPKYYGERFIDRLDLDKQTGSLKIKKIRPEHTGIYSVKLSSLNSQVTFNVIFDDSTETSRNESMNTGFMGRIQNCCGLSRNRDVFRDEKDEMETRTVKEGGDLILKMDTRIQTDDEILLRFGTSFAKRRPYVTIARFGKEDEFKSPERGFKERLQLDRTGPLTITIKNIKFTDYGDYYVQITNKRNKSFKSFTFIVVNPSDMLGDAVESVQGKTVDLKTYITDIQKDDQILWTYGPYAMIIADSKDTSRCDKRFKERVVLDKETGFLTIKKAKTTDSGDYHLQIISSNRVRNQTFSVTVKDASTSLQITDDNASDQNEGDAMRAWYDELDELEATNSLIE